MNLKKAIACLVVSGMAVFGGNAFAVEQDLQAPVNILRTLAFEADTLRAVSFGTVEAPDGTSETVTISSDGDVSGTATTVGDDSINGATTLSGEESAVLVMSATAASCTGTGLSLSDFTFGASTLNDTGEATVRHGATLTMDGTADDVETGEQTCSYTVTAAY